MFSRWHTYSERLKQLSSEDSRNMARNIKYGWERDPKTGQAVVDAEQQAIIKRIMAMYEAGESNAAIARALNADGVPAPRGGVWRDTSVRKVLLAREGDDSKLTAGSASVVTKQRYGWKRDEKTGLFVEDPEQHAIVTRIKQAAYGPGKTTGEIARDLNAGGVPGPNGKPWTHKLVEKVLSSDKQGSPAERELAVLEALAIQEQYEAEREDLADDEFLARGVTWKFLGRWQETLPEEYYDMLANLDQYEIVETLEDDTQRRRPLTKKERAELLAQRPDIDRQVAMKRAHEEMLALQEVRDRYINRMSVRFQDLRSAPAYGGYGRETAVILDGYTGLYQALGAPPPFNRSRQEIEYDRWSNRYTVKIGRIGSTINGRRIAEAVRGIFVDLSVLLWHDIKTVIGWIGKPKGPGPEEAPGDAKIKAKLTRAFRIMAREIAIRDQIIAHLQQKHVEELEGLKFDLERQHGLAHSPEEPKDTAK
jgi:hypothetical protein